VTQKVALLSPTDLSKVQGSTEANYVADFLAENYDTHIYSLYDPEMADVTYHEIPGASVIPALLLYNILLLPYFLYQNHQHNFAVLYTYKGFHLTPFITTQLSDCDWIADFQTKPTGQEKEWASLSNVNSAAVKLYYGLEDVMYRLTLPYTKAVITLSEPIRTDLQEIYNVDPSRIQLVPLGVDSDKFRPERTQAMYTEPLNMVYLGSITSRRNLGVCIDAIAVKELRVDVRFHIVGDGPDKDINELKRKANEAGVEEEVCWHGYVGHEEIPAVLDRMDIAISPLPAHDSYEVSSPAKLFEYLAMGLPILCTDIRAHRNVLSAEQTGFFFEPKSPSSLVNAINRISELESEDWLRIRQHAREAGKENDWSSRMEVIKEIIEGQPSKSINQ
jgi:glycosyltransferase involved in cell wall biosynthesis